MSHKSTLFQAPHLRTHSQVAEHVTRKTNREVRQERKTGSWSPPSYAFSADDPDMRRSLAAALTASEPAQDVNLPLTLAESVMTVSALLAASDQALVQASRWEVIKDHERAAVAYARATAYEALAERTAKASRTRG